MIVTQVKAHGQPLFEENVRFFPPCAVPRPDVVSCGHGKTAIPAYSSLERRPPCASWPSTTATPTPASPSPTPPACWPASPPSSTPTARNRVAEQIALLAREHGVERAGAGTSHQHGRHPRPPLGKGPGHGGSCCKADHRPAGGPVGRAAHHHRRPPDPDEQRQKRQKAEKDRGRCGGHR